MGADSVVSDPSTLSSPGAVLTAELFEETLDQLIGLLSGLEDEEWDLPTVCAGWSVKDVALHLLGVEIGNLASRRDQHHLGGDAADWRSLVDSVNQWNQTWVEATRRVSSRLLLDLLGYVGDKTCRLFLSLDPFEDGPAVSWAGPKTQPKWLDIAREYTERWHHQQHIRDAVNRPGLIEPRYLQPVLETFIWALPHSYRDVTAAEGASIAFSILGDSGGSWTLLREKAEWRLFKGRPPKPDSEISMYEDFAWRFFTKGVTRRAARSQVNVAGNTQLAKPVFDTVSIIA